MYSDDPVGESGSCTPTPVGEYPDGVGVWCPWLTAEYYLVGCAGAVAATDSNGGDAAACAEGAATDV